MKVLEPYFMKDEKWYYFDEDKEKYVLTNEAPKKAIESYKEFEKLIKKD